MSHASVKTAHRKGAFTGTGTLLRFMLRRDRIKLPAWIGGLGLYILYTVSALPAAYSNQEELEAAVALYADPVGRLLTGPGYGFDNPTIQQAVANGYGLYLLILVALMSIFLVVRHTRVEEQTGRAELVRANVVGQYAALTATVGVAVIANLLVSAFVFLLMIGVGRFDAAGSLLFAVGAGAVGMAFTGIAAITVQLSEYSRAATGMAGAVLGAAFVVRAGGDMAAVGGNALSWLSPLAWAQQTAPFVLNRWWPLLLLVVLSIITILIGFRLSVQRDLGAGLMAARPGPSGARPLLGTSLGLAFRLQRASIIGWTIALFISGLVFGAFADSLLTATNEMPEIILELLGSSEGVVAGYLAYMTVFMAYIASVYAILAVQGVRNEETSGRAEPVLAAPVSRVRWLGSNLVVAMFGIILLMVTCGIATGVGAAIVTSNGSYVLDIFVAHLNQIPAVLVVLGITTLLFGILPRAIPVTWAVVGFAILVGTFGSLLNIPKAAFNFSPFEHVARMPLETFALTPTLVLTAIAVATIAGGLIGIRRRAINVK